VIDSALTYFCLSRYVLQAGFDIAVSIEKNRGNVQDIFNLAPLFFRKALVDDRIRIT